MAFEFILSLFIMAIGISVAGAGTYMYQGITGQIAALRYDGAHALAMFGHLVMSFVCGPYIILRMGLARDGESIKGSLINLLIASLVAFGWSFITGLLFLGSYFAIID